MSNKNDDFVIFAYKFFDISNNKLYIGGVETYIRDLALLSQKMGLSPIVYQNSSSETKDFYYDNIKIVPIVYTNKNKQRIFNKIIKKHAGSVIVISTDQMDVKTSYSKAIQIQHGIAFDIPGAMIKGIWGKNLLLQKLNKLLRCIKNVRRFSNTPNVVCVDYNFFNWYRTLDSIPANAKIKVIPNYSSSSISSEEFDNKCNSRTTRKRIIFARRFVDYRGTKLFAKVAKKILNDFDVEITFAGSGPLENFLKDSFKDEERVTITRFSASESIEFHKKYDIAVVPTIFSEGTSLSLCEAMSAGCVPIASHVGGMTNILLDGYNGFFSYPSSDEFYDILKMILEMPDKDFNKIAKRAYETVNDSFSKKQWESNWMKFIAKVKGE